MGKYGADLLRTQVARLVTVTGTLYGLMSVPETVRVPDASSS